MKSGFVAIIGKPNTGKSTLMNAMVGDKLSIVTPKAQTTRRKILGILTRRDFQVVFFDTPGIIAPKYEMQRLMMKYVAESVEEADAMLVLVDLERFTTWESYFDKSMQQFLGRTSRPVICAINKTDTAFDKRKILPVIAELDATGLFSDIVPISALKGDNLDELERVLIERLPEGHYYYDPDVLSTLPERFFTAEIIREQIFLMFREEVPYSAEVLIREFTERAAGKWYIAADIVVERASQKKIIIGAKGSAIKKLGQKSREEIEDHLGMPVFLELFVKVREHWRSDPGMLRSFGFNPKS